MLRNGRFALEVQIFEERGENLRSSDENGLAWNVIDRPDELD
jgi:hypothetical protein